MTDPRPLFFTVRDLEDRGFSPETDLSEPGTYPYTRGPQASMYRGKLWTMRQ
ncbi:MAG TPA: methylmalonyl-CoA mutase family protein, partial [Thermoanaerobaculia bacterium]